VAILIVLIGVIVGGGLSEGFGALAGGVLAWLGWRSVQQQGELAVLRGEIAILKMQRDDAATAVNPRPAPVQPAQAPALPRVADAAAQRVLPTAPAAASAPRPVVQRPAAAQSASPAAVSRIEIGASARAPATPRADPFAGLKAWLFGGNTIVKAGVGILFIGLAFLAKYATENISVPVEFRLAGIAAAALALLVVGWRLRFARPGYGQILQGAAVAVLYLTLFVAFRFYGVLAAGPVFGLMVLVAAFAAALAVLQDARSLAVVGALGGFAVPLLISTGSGNHIALFSYYLVLDLGIAAVAWHKTWRALNLVGFAGTFLVATAWGVLKYQAVNYPSSQAFLVAFFILFIAILMMPARRLPTGHASGAVPADGWVQGSLLFGLPTITFVLQYGLVHDTPYGVALSALLMAAFYVGLAVLMRSRPGLALPFEASLGVGTVLLTLVIPFALDARSTSGAWALEGAALVWLGFRQSRRLPRGFGYLLLGSSCLAMGVAYERYGAPTALFNAAVMNGLLAAVACLLAAFCVHRFLVRPAAASGSAQPAEAIAEPVLIAVATAWSLVAAWTEIDAFVAPTHVLAAWLVALSLMAWAANGLTVRLDWATVALPNIGHAPLLALGVVVSAIGWASPAAGGGWWAWPLALATHLGVLRFAASRWPAPVQTAIHALGVLVLAALGALQGSAITRPWGEAGSAWPWLGWLVLPAVLSMALLRPAVARRWPISAAPIAYRSIAAAVLAAGLVLWSLLANVASDGSASPLPYLPLVNPLDLGVGVALLAAWLWLRSDGLAALPAWGPNGQPPALLPFALIGAAGFVWLNAMLIRAFHHFDGVPFTFDAWMSSRAVQTGITLLWAGLALVLMWLSARRSLRWPWVVGAALLGAVVLKLLMVDLSGSGTIARIVSFIGVGVLMLVIGYVAPLPSRAAPLAARELAGA
jgi:uncharacterized membrane protein